MFLLAVLLLIAISFFHYKNLLDLGVLGQAYSPRKGAADELGGSSVR